jgi:tRNA A-37 threonylcarbamoyl transferase component Bud32
MSIHSDNPRPDTPEAPTLGSSKQVVGKDLELPANLEAIRLLGHGSMATVILARDTILKRLVAVKLLRKELSADPTCRRRFEREAQAAARLTHDRVTTVYSVGRLDTDEPYIVMQYVDGNNLSDILNAHGPFGIDEAVGLLVQISAALAAAHQQNVVHRDVKPANVLIDNKTGQATLTDFGIAAILESGTETMTRLTRVDERLGNPRYMSPEQLRGEPLTGQADIYSLGIIGYELLTGKGPFDDLEIGSMASAHLRRPPPDLSQLRVDVPQSISDALKHCLAKNPKHRPRAQDLPSLLQDPVGLSPGEGPVGPVVGFLRELMKRKVYRTGAAYAAASFLVLQAADLVLPALTESDTLYQITVITCLAGFPIAIVFAWIFDLRDGRLVRTDDDEVALSLSTTPLQRLLLKVVGLGLSIALVVVIARWLLPM